MAAGCPAAETRAGGMGAPVTQALTYFHASHLIIWVNLSAASGQRLYCPSPRADWLVQVRVGGPSQPEPARNLKGHSDMNAVQASVLG